MNNLAPFEIVYCPETISAGRVFQITVKINSPLTLEIDSDLVKFHNGNPVSFDSEGIYSACLICDRIINDFSFVVKSGDHSKEVKIKRSCEKPLDDNINISFDEIPDSANLIKADLTSFLLECAKARGYNTDFPIFKADCTENNENISLLSQYLSYMSGNNDFYLEKPNKFYEFANSHTRTGKYHTSLAYVLGQNDKTDDFADIFSSVTPNADIISLKNGALENYKTLCLLGENTITEENVNDMLAFVHTGGTLICGLRVFGSETNKLAEYIFSDKHDIICDSYCGIPINIAPNVKCDDIIATSDSGHPLAFIRRVGLGQIFFINALESPEQNGVKPLYKAIISELYDNLKAEERIFISGDKEIAFTVYNQQDNARHIYLLALNNLKPHRAILNINRDKYKIDVPFGSMLKIVAKDNLAVWSEDESVEVLLITANVVTLQGYGKTKIKYAKNGEVSEREIDFTHKPIQAIQI